MASKKKIKGPLLFAFVFAAGAAIGASVLHLATREEPYRPLLTDFPEFADRARQADPEDFHSDPAAPKKADASSRAVTVTAPATKTEPKPASSAPGAAAKTAAPAAAAASAPVEGPRVVFVLDDWGYNLEAFSFLKEIKRPLTLAVLPALPYSERVSREGAALGHDVILHMPVEAQSAVAKEKLILLAGMPAADAQKTLFQSLATVPGARGVSNHQGSKGTEDPALMRAVVSALKKKGLYFFDSLTTQNSAVDEVSAELGVPYVKRDVFLDNERTDAAVQARLDDLKAIALKRGLAIGIGHDEPVTLRAIQRNIPLWEKEGIRVVSLSQIFKEKGHAS